VGSIRKVRYKERDTLRVPILLPQNIPTAIVCTTLTTVLLGGKPRVTAEFFAFLNIAFGNNPDGALGDQHFTIGISGVIDGAGFVFEGLAIDIIAVIECKDVLVALI
jgi:hypothetical protein